MNVPLISEQTIQQINTSLLAIKKALESLEKKTKELEEKINERDNQQ